MKNNSHKATGDHIAVKIPKILFDRVDAHCKAKGIDPHAFVTEAVSEKLASLYKEKRKKQRL